MAFNVFVSETLRGLSVRDDFMRVFCGDLREFLFADFDVGDVVVVSVGDTMPGKILPLPIDKRTNRVFFVFFSIPACKKLNVHYFIFVQQR